jgi:hypothetical protein
MRRNPRLDNKKHRRAIAYMARGGVFQRKEKKSTRIKTN